MFLLFFYFRTLVSNKPCVWLQPQTKAPRNQPKSRVERAPEVPPEPTKELSWHPHRHGNPNRPTFILLQPRRTFKGSREPLLFSEELTEGFGVVAMATAHDTCDDTGAE